MYKVHVFIIQVIISYKNNNSEFAGLNIISAISPLIIIAIAHLHSFRKVIK